MTTRAPESFTTYRTSSVVSIASSDGASSMRSSRSVKFEAARIGSPAFQSLVVTIALPFCTVSSLVRIMVVARRSNG